MDLLSNYVCSLKNACLSNNSLVNIQASKVLLAVSTVLKDQGLLESVKVVKKNPNKIFLQVKPSFISFGKAKIREIRRVSTPGFRKYWSSHDIKKNKLFTHGSYIISTSKGVMIDEDAIKQKIGGEVICRIVKR